MFCRAMPITCIGKHSRVFACLTRARADKVISLLSAVGRNSSSVPSNRATQLPRKRGAERPLAKREPTARFDR